MALWSLPASPFVLQTPAAHPSQTALGPESAATLYTVWVSAMAPQISVAKQTLSYPLYCVDFIDQDHLIVAGGGGESKTGIGNKIVRFHPIHSFYIKLILILHQSIVNVTKKTNLQLETETELSRDEDSVTSLAVRPGVRHGSATIYGGVNCSTAALRSHANEHFRVFEVTDGPPKEDDGKQTLRLFPLSQSSLFKPDSPRYELYQRITRVCRQPASTSTTVVIASGSASSGQVLLLIQQNGAGAIQLEASIDLENEEAEDLDVCDGTDGRPLIAFFTADRVFVLSHQATSSAKQLSLPTQESPRKGEVRLMYTVSAISGGQRSKLRALRFLSPNLIVLLLNKPGRSGAEIQILRLFGGDGDIVLRRTLHNSIKVATGVDVTLLKDPAGREDQAVLAVASQNISIEIFTLDIPSTGIPTRFTTIRLFRNVHDLPITNLKFNHWTPPPQPIGATVEAQYLKLASVSIGKTAVVHTIQLTPTPPTSKQARYVAYDRQSDTLGRFSLVAIVLVVFLSISLQVGLEYFNISADRTGITSNLLPLLQQHENEPMTQAPTATAMTQEVPKVGKLSELPDDMEGLVMIRDSRDNVIVDVAPEGEIGGKRWHEMEEHEKARWREKLTDAGHWAADEGETILKSLIFGQIAGFVGQAVAGG